MSYKIEVFCDASYRANTYLIYNNEKCIIVDPANNIKTLKKYIGERHLVGILLTHGHYDHFMELFNLLNEFDTLVYMHKNAYKKIFDNSLSCASIFGCYDKFELKEEQVVFVDEGKKIDFGFVNVKAMYFPGHTNCSMMYQIDKMVFCGDVIFPLSVGRNDLPTGNIVSLCESLKRIKKMEHDVVMYPGHDNVFILDSALRFNPYLK